MQIKQDITRQRPSVAHPGKGVVCMVEMILAILLVVAITEAVKYIKK